MSSGSGLDAAAVGAPFISILTPSYNQGKYIERTILSVLQQNYPHFEHIVIDGGSTDETIEILRKYPHLKWISQRDRGQADALNKGLQMVTGEIVGWLNSDDFYAAGAFEQVHELFQDEQLGWAIGDTVDYFDDSDRELYRRSQVVSYESVLRDPDIVRQQGAFFRADLLRRAGGWDPELHMVMDLDLWLRLAQITAPRMMNEKLAYFRIHPEQKSRAELHLLQTREIDCVLKRHGVSPRARLRYRAKKYCWAGKGAIKARLIKMGVLPSSFRLRNSPFSKQSF